jgi:hypothetical protein
MVTKIIKLVAVAALLMAALPEPGAAYRVVLEFVVCASGVVVMLEAARARKYIWMIAFGVVVILYNPLVPVALSRKTLIGLDFVCVLMFLISLAVLHTRSTLSMPSITDRTPGSESL